MALINKTDPVAVAVQLRDSLAKRFPSATEVSVTDVVIPQSSGMSNDTVLFTGTWVIDGELVERRLVARIAPTGPTLFPSSDLETEGRVLGALAASDVPVPEVLFYEGDASLLGAPFLVMLHVDGKAAADDPPFTATGWFVDLDPADRAKALDNGLQALAAIHAFDWRSADLGDLDRSTDGQDMIDVLIEELRDFHTWANSDLNNPTVEAGLDWLVAHRPAAAGDSVLNWGDARFGNLLVAEDASIGAVLDWELVTTAPRELDLGWWIFLNRHHTDGIGVPRPEGFPAPEEVVARYEELTGHSVADINFYEVIAAVRLSILTQRAASLLADAGVLPAGHPMLLANPATNLLAQLTGLPSPEGDTASPMHRDNL